MLPVLATDLMSRSEVARGQSIPRLPSELRSHLQPALSLLLQAWDYAIELEQDVWNMAVELDVLRAAKLTNSDLRWLAAKGYVEHGVEATGLDDSVRHFRRTPLPMFTELTCVVLTPIGAAAARELCEAAAAGENIGPAVALCEIGGLQEVQRRPNWDQQRRQLRVGGQIVKEFKLPSPNQETVLMAFEEEGWPPRIDDPLPPVGHLDSRRRLHDTIKALNRKQKRLLIRFRGDGSGEGIRWEPAIEPAESRPATLASDPYGNGATV
ncbi:MAG: hypothetical protein AB7O59_15365 [Pirellulales bacterium]